MIPGRPQAAMPGPIAGSNGAAQVFTSTGGSAAAAIPMQEPASHHLDLYRYWLSKRGTRIMPARGDINPADIVPLLPYLMIVERAGDQFRYRQVGNAIVEAVGYDATGITVGTYIAVHP
jgi:PAS domain